SVGVGDVPRLDDEPAVAVAVDRAGAADVVAKLGAGLETQLGPTWPDGVEVSFGQWQKLALARGFMRDEPLLLVLDEPTAALDAETEHALFERYAAAAQGVDRTGRITILVSHRFSTVRMADLIVVLDGARGYGWYAKAVEQDHWDEYGIVRPDGKMILAPETDDLMEKTLGMDHPDNWMFKVGKIAAFELL